MRTRMMVILVAVSAGCGGDDDDDDTPPDPQCEAADQIAGVCAGAPTQPVCDGETCVDGAPCAEVHEVGDAADLAAALAAAGEGDCIALTPGSYGTVTLPAGVSLLGRSSADVIVEGVVVGGGGAATLRGLQITAGGVRIEDDAQVLVEATQIVGPSDDALLVGQGAALTLLSSTIRGAGGLGVRAVDTADITIRRSIVEGSTGPGIWAECADGCACAAPATVTLELSSVRENGIVGLALVGVAGALSQSQILENPVAEDFVSSGGLAASQCADLHATGLEVRSNAGFGVLIDGSTAVLGGAGEGEALSVADNFIGLWVQESSEGDPATVELTGSELYANRGVGLGIAGGAADVAVLDTTIQQTESAPMPVFDVDDGAGVMDVGDAIDWLDGARVSLEGVTLRGNARASVLIDGAADPASAIVGLTLEDGDEELGVVQQNLPLAASAVTTDGVAVTTFEVRQIAIPQTLAAPVPP